MITVLGRGICRTCRAFETTMFTIQLPGGTILKWVLCGKCDLRHA